jgi:hypothetical protein
MPQLAAGQDPVLAGPWPAERPSEVIAGRTPDQVSAALELPGRPPGMAGAGPAR